MLNVGTILTYDGVSAELLADGDLSFKGGE